MKFDGINDFIRWCGHGGERLNATNFTLELWFNRTERGLWPTLASVGRAYPLVAKGRNETDGGTIDVNYFFGLDTTVA